MNYLHACHAGNFADVFKHALLLLLLQALRRKDAAFCYVDSHAGSGVYDLRGADAQRTGEYHNGAEKIFTFSGDLPAGLAEYRAHLRALNPDGVLRWYPGSPHFAVAALREHDRAILIESQETVYRGLKQAFVGDRRVAVHRRDAYEALKGLLPPPQKRGLVLIDPPYEAQEGEFTPALAALQAASRRWPQASIALWYPIKHRPPVAHFQRQVQRSGLRDVAAVELCVLPCDNRLQLNGCGLLLLRPPWQFTDMAQAVAAPLRQHLGRGPQAESAVFTLVEE